MSESTIEKREGGVLVTGATGLIGGQLLPGLRDRFAWVRTLSRSGSSPASGIDARTWDGIDPGTSTLDGVETIVHLAGEPIFGGAPTAARLARVRSSRIESTRRMVERIAERPAAERPFTFVCASAVGIYPDSGDTPLDESAANGDGFLSRVCQDWESTAQAATAEGVRVVNVRIGVVLDRDGGALGLMRLPFSLGVGGRLGSGRQYFPWIHVDDLVRVLLLAVDEPLEGAINAVGPEAARNSDLTRELGRVLRRPAFIPVPAFAIRLALGDLASELLDSKRVVPARLEAAGFEFDHPTLAGALEAELGK
ncbi:MAG: TIGR01777 family oxidoreductase [Myxococcota bacterium]